VLPDEERPHPELHCPFCESSFTKLTGRAPMRGFCSQCGTTWEQNDQGSERWNIKLGSQSWSVKPAKGP
jgi:hypothetical protein